MMKLFPFALFFGLLWGGIVRTGENVDFGKYLPVFPNEIINCPILNIECNQYKNGVILSPYFPIKITDERLFRKYRLFINTECPSLIILTVARDDYLVGNKPNAFTVGFGSEVNAVNGSIKMNPLFRNDNDFLKNNDSLTYDMFYSSNWIEIDASEGFFRFNISYSVFPMVGNENDVKSNSTYVSSALDTTSLVCSIISITCLALTFFIHTIFRSLKTKRTILIQNLCITFIISQILMMIRNLIVTFNINSNLYNDVICPIIGMIVHYFLLVAFMFMLIEGFQLYEIVKHVFEAWTTKLTIIYVVVAYAVPLLILIITVVTASFVEEDVLKVYKNEHISCWLDDHWAFAFAIPAAAITLANLFFLIVGVRAWWNLKGTNQESPIQKIKETFLRVASQTLFLALSGIWVMGFLLSGYYPNFNDVFWLVFTICNGLKGVFIFVDRCILNTKIRTALTESFNRLNIYLASKLQCLIHTKEVNQNISRSGLQIQNNGTLTSQI